MLQGDPGSKGVPGLPGDDGEPGMKGERGNNGRKGIPGDPVIEFHDRETACVTLYVFSLSFRVLMEWKEIGEKTASREEKDLQETMEHLEEMYKYLI